MPHYATPTLSSQSINHSLLSTIQWKRDCKTKLQTHLRGQCCTTAEAEKVAGMGRHGAHSKVRWQEALCCSLGRSTRVTVKKKTRERDAASIRLSAQVISNWIRHAIWSGGLATAGAERRNKRRACTAGEQPSPNKKTNQRVNTEDVQTDGPDLCSVVDTFHCFCAGGSRGTCETKRKRGCESVFKGGLRKKWKLKEKQWLELEWNHHFQSCLTQWRKVINPGVDGNKVHLLEY